MEVCVCVCVMISELNRDENNSDIVRTAPPHSLTGQSLTSCLQSPRLLTLPLLLLHRLILKNYFKIKKHFNIQYIKQSIFGFHFNFKYFL